MGEAHLHMPRLQLEKRSCGMEAYMLVVLHSGVA